MDRTLPRPGGQNKFVRLLRTTYLRLARMAERMEKLRVNKPLILQDVGGSPVISINWQDEVFIANIQKDGGSDGTTSSPASWTYTIKRLGTTVATGVVQDKPRPNGSMTPGDLVAGSAGFGLCFYGSDGAVHLWDAGEVEKTSTCAG